MSLELLLRTEFWVEDERFWQQFQREHPKIAKWVERDAETGCWIWTGANVSSKRRPSARYGKATLYLGRVHKRLSKQEWWLAHRLVYTLLQEEFPKEYEVHHWCKNTLCCSPLHCEPMSSREHTELDQELEAEGYVFQPPPRPREYADENDLPF